MVHKEPRFPENRGRSSQNRGRFPQSPELDSVNLDSIKTGEAESPASQEERKPNPEKNSTASQSPTASQSQQKSKPSAAPRRDPRYESFRAVLIASYEQRGQLYDFGARDGAALRTFLSEHPLWTVEDVAEAVNFYFRSAGVVQTDAVRFYLPKLEKYQCGYLDVYGKVVEGQETRSSRAKEAKAAEWKAQQHEKTFEQSGKITCDSCAFCKAKQAERYAQRSQRILPQSERVSA